MSKPIAMSLLPLLLLAAPACADEAAEVDVVQRYVQAWNQSDAEALMAVRAPDATNYRPPTGPDALIGEAAAPTPLDDGARRAYYRQAFARQPHPHVEVLDTLVMEDLVVSRERVTGLADGVGEELTVYQVRDGRIQALWHLRRAVH